MQKSNINEAEILKQIEDRLQKIEAMGRKVDALAACIMNENGIPILDVNRLNQERERNKHV